MRFVYMSDDGKIHLDAAIQGSDRAVRDYEEKQRDPLAKMRFPYLAGSGLVYGNGQSILGAELVALVAFANLAPLYKECRGIAHSSSIMSSADLRLSTAFDEALELAKKL